MHCIARASWSRLWTGVLLHGVLVHGVLVLWAMGLGVAAALAEELADTPPQQAMPAEQEAPTESDTPTERDAPTESGTPPESNASAEAEVPAADLEKAAALHAVKLPESFDLLRPIHFFQGHASGLVPDSFRPITIAQLDDRLRAEWGISRSAFEKPQLIRAVYVARLVDTTLVSMHSTWEISYTGDLPARLVLGKIGVALQSTFSSGGPQGPLVSESVDVVTDPEGNVSVSVQGDTKLSLAWTAAGRDSDREVFFDLAIPKAGQTRWLIEVPQGLQVQALDGVVQALPSPPPEAGIRDLGRGTTWFAIEAGGLSRVRLRVLKMAPDSPEAAVAVRQAAMQYELAPASIRFTSRLVIDPPADGTLPPLEVHDGRITSVSVDGSSANWTETSIGGSRMIRIDSGRLDPLTVGPVNITIDGEAAWINRTQLQKLPWLQFRECVPILVGNEMQAKVLVDSRLSLPRLVLPSTWRYTSPLESDERRTTYRLGGPWVSEAPAVRAVPDAGQLFADSLLRLSATETRLRAVMESSIDLGSVGPQPVRLRMEPSWTPEVVLLPQSGRAVDLPTEASARHNIVIWPTADELKNGRLMIRVVGSQSLVTDGNASRYPSTSFLSISNCRNRCAAVVTPPPGFRWMADASLRTNRIGVDRLSLLQREMIGELAAEALLLDISQARIAALESRRPTAAFSVSSLMRLSLENQRLVETYVVKCESASGELNQVRIEFASGHRPDIEWSVQDQANSTRRLIRARRLTTGLAGASQNSLIASDSADELVSLLPESAEPREIWELELERADARHVVLVGRREYPLPPPDPSDRSSRSQLSTAFRVDLPSVTGASTRLAQVLVGPTLEVQRCGDGVLRVPQLVGGDLLAKDSESLASSGSALRYDSTGTTWIEVQAIASSAPVPVLWQESVNIVASGRGGDWIYATYSADAGSTLVIDHDPGLRLVSVTDQHGTRLDYDHSGSRLSIKAMPTSTQVSVQWSRPASSTDLWQPWSPPRISVAGVLLRRDWQLVSAADTLIPSSLVGALKRRPSEGLAVSRRLLDRVADDHASAPRLDVLALRLDPDLPRSLWLIDRSIGLSLIAVMGCLLFGLSWWIAGRSVIVVGIGFAVSVLLLAGLPDGWFYWVAGVCVPIAAGALVGTTLAASRAEERLQKASGSSGNAAVQTADRRGRPSASPDMTQTVDGVRDPSSRSLLGKLGNWSIAGLVVSLATVADAQQRDMGQPSSAGSRAIVLIPNKSDGSPAGDKVYISQGLFNELFRGKAASATSPLITSAVYRLRLEGMTESGMPTAEWEVRYALADLGERSELLLPIRPAQVRSVQWLPDGEAKPLRWNAEGETQIRISLPPAPSAAVLLRLSSEVESPEKWVRRIQFAIPAVASASLVVDSSSAVQRFELAGAMGQTLSEPEERRLSASLGTSKSIDLTVRLRQGSRGIPVIAARRYWVHASEDRCQVECEIDPGEEPIRRGGDVPIVILGGPPPILTSTDWAIHGSETISSRRQLLTLRALRDGPEPIRLLWDLESTVSSADSLEAAAAVILPDVISAGSAQTPEALIALHAAEGLRLTPQGPLLVTTADSADAVDAFVANWQGYRGTAQQVVRSPSPLARLIVSETPSRQWRSDENHHLHIRPNEMRLTYEATITRGERPIGPLRVTLPPGSDVRELMVNGVSIASAAQQIGKRSEISLPEPAGTEKIRLRVVTHQRLTSSEPFQPPRIRIQPIRQVAGSYSLTRNQALRVEQVTDTGLPEIETPPLDIADQLLNGWIPCWTWKIDERAEHAGASLDQLTELPGQFRIELQSPRLDVLQQTTVRWRQSRWMMDAVIRVRARSPEGDELPLLDDVNIELPTAWSDQLLVEPAEAWSSQPAIDPSMKVIRIRPDVASREAGKATIRIQGLRIGEADSLLEVPKLQLLGAASRRSYLVVPKSTAGRPLVWKALSAVADQLPDAILSEPTGATAGRADAENQLVFRALNNTATVRLEPSRSETTVARATSADIQLFPQSAHQWLVIMRWDLEPGDRDRMRIHVPAGAAPIAVWTAGKPFLLKGQSSDSGHFAAAETSGASVSTSPTTLDVTLSLSQLAQPLVMLCRLRVDRSGSRPELPRLIDTHVEQTWLTLYKPSRQPGSGSTSRMTYKDDLWQASRPQDRWLLLAHSVLQVTESSISGATDRPQEEVIAWLKSWDERLAKLKSEARRWDADARDPLGEADAESEESEETPSDSTANEDDEDEHVELSGPWEPIERAWRQYTRRVTGGEASPGGDPSPAIMPAAHWQVASVARHPGAAERLPMLTIRGDSSKLSLAIQLLIGLVMVIGCALLAWRFESFFRPLLTHPAFWLFAVGFASLAVAPTPVALAICLVAVSAPWLSSRSGSAGNASKANRDISARRAVMRP